jgi:flavin reductase (DIM6/NTAB) family NADH-FMN oxidoreductase RutF
MSYDPDKLRQTMRMWATGVTIVSTQADSRRLGMTVSSFTSVTLEPPLILVCIQKHLPTAQAILESQAFAVSMLGQEHEGLSNRFAGFTPLAEGEDRFDGVAVQIAQTGAPILQEAMGWLDCRLHSVLDGSTHHIFMGQVVEASGYPAEGQIEAPLLYYNRGYRTLAPTP